ncbi:hypothetical protein D3C84_780420 [compost metagenome]
MFEIGFLGQARVGHAKKFQYYRVPDEVTWVCLHVLDVGGGFVFDGRPVAACQQALVVEGVDLAFQGAR